MASLGVKIFLQRISFLNWRFSCQNTLTRSKDPETYLEYIWYSIPNLLRNREFYGIKLNGLDVDLNMRWKQSRIKEQNIEL